MGRQIRVAASLLDEDLFLGFLRESADIQLFRSFAPTQEELWVDQFAPFGPMEIQYFVWNKRYAWKPKYKRTQAGDASYIEDKLHGPVIEFCRTDMEGFLTKNLVVGTYGRVYWAQYNRQKGFLSWYDNITRWVRRTGENLCPGTPLGVYCLPGALALWNEREKKPQRR
jgi:hypothetical protein